MKYIYIPVTAKVVKLLWHGTSSKNLHSILKNGLLPPSDTKHKTVVWDKITDNTQSFFNAIYLTNDVCDALQYATRSVNKYGGNPLLVLTSISLGNDVIFDDNSLLFISEITHSLPNKGNNEQLGGYLKRCNSIYKDKLQKWLSKNFGIPADRLDYVMKSQAVDQLVKLVLTAKYSDTVNEPEFYESQEYKDAKKRLLFQLRTLTGASTKVMTQGKFKYSITAPIKYKGNRKILAIYETDDKFPSPITKNFIKELGAITFVKKYGSSKWNRELSTSCERDYFLSDSEIIVR